MGWFSRSVRPPDYTPNPNPPGASLPGTVGPPSYTPGDPDGVTVAEGAPPGDVFGVPPAMPWSGWPADWFTPAWNTPGWSELVGTAWVCVDLNASLLSTMPPYLVGAAPTLNADWLNNPQPDVYTSWEEFAKTLFWDYQAAGEAYVLATARYATGWPARFHIVPNYLIEISLDYDTGVRTYMLGADDVTADLLHIRYRSTLTSLHGEGPLAAVGANLVASQLLTQYAASIATSGGIPSSVLSHPEELSAEQAAQLQAQWVNARMSNLGEPAVLSGGVTWQAASLNPKDMALQEMAQFNDARIAIALGVPPFLAGLPSGAESYTYKSVHDMFDYHWRAGLRPKAQAVMSALSGWLLPRGTWVEVNRDAYVEPNPLERAQTYQVLASIVDPATGQQAMTVDEIRQAERLSNSTPSDDLAGGMLK